MPDDAEGPAQQPAGRPNDDAEARQAAAAARIKHQNTWVDLQLRQAIERGAFEDLPGYGKPLEGLTGKDDPDWWVRRLVEREQITGVVPPSLQMRREDAELDERLDRLPSEAEVRREVEEFNARVRWALYRPPEGPPMVTPQRDVAIELERWAARREERVAAWRAREQERRSAGAEGQQRRGTARRLRERLRRTRDRGDRGPA